MDTLGQRARDEINHNHEQDPPSYQASASPTYEQATSASYHQSSHSSPAVLYPRVHMMTVPQRTSRIRLALVGGIMLLLGLLYLTSNWTPPYVSHFDQQRLFFEQQQLEVNRNTIGLLGPQRKYGGSSDDHSIPTVVGHNPKLPSLLARPLKYLPESLRLINSEKIKEWFNKLSQPSSSQTCTTSGFWQAHHHETNSVRLKRLRWMCNIYGFNDRIFTFWHRSSNRRQVGLKGVKKYCTTLHCPLIVNEDYRLLSCFVQKVASTSLKQFFLYLNDNAGQHNLSSWSENKKVTNLTTFHQRANEELYRISPMYIHRIKDSSYFKTLFVRHPFVRLVSAFKDKAERGPDQEPYFYAQYWYPMLKNLKNTRKGDDRNIEKITFKEFVEELLLKTDPYQYDEHWAPIWTRCEPCYMHYDFIGKLENSQVDFRNFKSHVDENLANLAIWENSNKEFGGGRNVSDTLGDIHTAADTEEKSNNKEGNSASTAKPEVSEENNEENDRQCQLVKSKYAETVRYLVQLSPVSLVKLYKIYYLDFELFGYTLEELFEVI